MKRRSFLGAVAGVVPALGIHDYLAHAALSQTPATPPTGDLHVVGVGEDRLGQPHNLPWSSMTFKVTSSETAGRLLMLEHMHLKPGGPPLHMHLNQEEWFYVMEGEVAFQVGEQRLRLKAGESVLAPRRAPHTFSLMGPELGRMLIAFSPAGKMEQYFRDAGKPREAGISEADYWRRYEMELIGPSPFAVSA